jgi:hypothetical protein
MKNRFIYIKKLVEVLVIATGLGISPSLFAANDIRIELPVQPEVSRYKELLEFPGYFGVALEINGLSPSMSSKLEVRDLGRTLKVRNGEMRYIDKKGSLYIYEASVGINLGVATSNLIFPVVVDFAQIASGKMVVTLRTPLANFLPDELIDRVRTKASMVANASAQKIMVDYLDALTKSASAENKVNVPSLIEPILIDAYNKGGGVSAFGARDVGDAVPLKDQWMLILTLLVWLIAIPAYLLFLRTKMHRIGQARVEN